MKKILFLSITAILLLNAETRISIGTVNGNVHSLSGDNSTINITNNKVTKVNKDNIETHIDTHIENIENDIDTDIDADTVNGDLQSTSGNNSDIKKKDEK